MRRERTSADARPAASIHAQALLAALLLVACVDDASPDEGRRTPPPLSTNPRLPGVALDGAGCVPRPADLGDRHSYCYARQHAPTCFAPDDPFVTSRTSSECTLRGVDGPYCVPDETSGGQCCYAVSYSSCNGRPLTTDEGLRVAVLVRGAWV